MRRFSDKWNGIRIWCLLWTADIVTFSIEFGRFIGSLVLEVEVCYSRNILGVTRML